MTEKLTHEEIRKREVLKTMMESELFEQAWFDVRQSLGEEMLRTNDPAQREKLWCEASLLGRLKGKMTEYCAELVFLKTGDAA